MITNLNRRAVLFVLASLPLWLGGAVLSAQSAAPSVSNDCPEKDPEDEPGDKPTVDGPYTHSTPFVIPDEVKEEEEDEDSPAPMDGPTTGGGGTTRGGGENVTKDENASRSAMLASVRLSFHPPSEPASADTLLPSAIPACADVFVPDPADKGCDGLTEPFFCPGSGLPPVALPPDMTCSAPVLVCPPLVIQANPLLESPPTIGVGPIPGNGYGAIFDVPDSTDQLWLFDPHLSPTQQRLERRRLDGTIEVYELNDTTFAVNGATIRAGIPGTSWRVSTIIDPHDNQTVYTYDGRGRLLTVRWPNGIEQRWFYHEPYPAAPPYTTPSKFAGWDANNYSFAEIRYFDNHASLYLSDDYSHAIVYENGPSNHHRHERGRIFRLYRSVLSIVDATGAGGRYDPGTAKASRRVVQYNWDVPQRWNRLLGTELGCHAVGSNADYAFITTDPFIPWRSFQYNGAGEIVQEMEGDRLLVFDYDEPVTRADSDTFSGGTLSGQGVVLKRKETVDELGNVSAVEFDLATNRVYRREFLLADSAAARPRKYDSDVSGLALPPGSEEEVERLTTDYYYGDNCSCGLARRIVTTATLAGGASLSRTVEYDYYDNGLVQEMREPSPTGTGWAATRYTYSSGLESGDSGVPVPEPGISWSATLPETVEWPNGSVTEWTYGFAPRGNLEGYGYRIGTRVEKTPVTVLEDSTTTSTHDVSATTIYNLADTTRPLGMVDAYSDGDGVQETFEYDAYGHLVRHIRGVVATAYDIGPWGDLRGVTRQEGAGANEHVVTISEAPDGRRYSWSCTVDGVENRTDYFYERFGKLAVQRRRALDSAGQTLGRQWIETHYEYAYRRLLAVHRDAAPLDAPSPKYLTTELDYSLNGHLVGIVAPNGTLTELVVDGAGVPYGTRIWDAADKSGESVWLERLFRNGLQEPVAALSGEANEELLTTIQRNGAGYVTQIQTPAATAPFDAGSAVIPGATIQTTYDDSGDPVLTAVFSGANLLQQQLVEYDELRRVRKTTEDVLSQSGVDQGYDRVLVHAYAPGKATHLDQTLAPSAQGMVATQYQFDPDGRLVRVVAPSGDAVEYTFAASTDFVARIERELADQVAGAASHYVETVVTDSFGRAREISSLGDGQATALTYKRRYSSLGVLESMEDPLGKVDEYHYDGLLRQVGVTRHPRSGSSANPIVTTTEYVDEPGTPTSEVKRFDPNGNVTRTVMDFAGRPVARVMPGGTLPTAANKHQAFATYAEYDGASRLSDVYDGDGGHVRFFYDGAGRVIIRDFVNHGAVSASPSGIDPSPLTRREEITRDAIGRAFTHRTYGPLNAGGPARQGLEQVDSLGRLTLSQSDPLGIGALVAPGVGGANVLSVASSYAGASGFRDQVTLSDMVGSPDVAPLTLDMSGDVVDRLTGIDWTLPSSGSSVLASYKYEGGQVLERATTLTAPNTEIITTRALDAYGRLTSIEDVLDVGGALSTLADYGYIYDEASNLLEEVYSPQAGGVGDVFAYDGFHRLQTGYQGASASRDAQGLPTAATKKLDWDLDESHNRQSVVTETAFGQSGSSTSTETYQTAQDSNRYSVVGNTPNVHDGRGNLHFDGRFIYYYDFANRLTEIYEIRESEPVQSFGFAAQSSSASSSTSFTILNQDFIDGRRLQILDRFECDACEIAERRSDPSSVDDFRADVTGAAVQNQGGGGYWAPPVLAQTEIVLVEIYQYDVYNRRTARLSSDGSVYAYGWDGWREAQMCVYDSVDSRFEPVQQYVWGARLDELVAYRSVESDTEWFVGQDRFDSPRTVSDGSGSVAGRFEYSSYGDQRRVSGSGAGLPFGWQGMRVDRIGHGSQLSLKELGYRRHRYFDFETGRWITADRIGAWGDVANWGNAYAYAGSNPEGYLDYTGEFGFFAAFVAIVVVSAVVGAIQGYQSGGAKGAVAGGVAGAVAGATAAVLAPATALTATGLATTGFAVGFTGSVAGQLASDGTVDQGGAVADGFLTAGAGAAGAAMRGGGRTMATGSTSVGGGSSARPNRTPREGIIGLRRPASSPTRATAAPRPAPSQDPCAARGGPDLDDLSTAGRALDPADKAGRLTKAGRSLQKHRAGGRADSSKFPGVKGPPESWNAAGQLQLDDILTTPGSTTTRLGRGGWQVTTPDGRGVRFNADGSFSGFVE